MKFMKVGMLVIVLQVLCLGCGDQRDLNNLAIITTLGFDKITDVDGVDKWQVSALVLQAGKLEASGVTTGTTKPEIVWRGKGATISEGILDFIKRSPRIPFFADTSSVIIGERAAREDLIVIIDYLNRLREQRPGTSIFLTKGAAASLFEAEPEAALSVSKELDQSKQDSTGINRCIKLMTFTTDLLSSDRDPVAPQVRLIYPQEKRGGVISGPLETTLVEGLGIIKDGKLVGWLNKEETMAYNLVTKKTDEAAMPIRIEKDGKWFVFMLKTSKPSIKVSLIEDKLKITLKLETRGSIVEDNGVDLTPSEMVDIEQTIAGQIGQKVSQTIETVQTYDADCLGFSEKLHRYSSNDWKKVKAHWRELFASAYVDVQVIATVENTGRLGDKLQLNK